MTSATVLGDGIIGLWTADILFRAGHDVTVMARSGYANSTSAAAACVLVPLLPGDPADDAFKRGLRWAKETLEHMQMLDGSNHFLERMPCYEFGVEGRVEYDFPLEKLRHIDYFSNFTVVNLGRLVAGCNTAIQFECYLCNSMVFLEWLYESLQKRGVVFAYRNVASLAEIANLDAEYVFNCLGYQTLFPDAELYPVFGQSMYIPVPNQSGDSFGIGAGDHAVFKHKRGFHVGAYFLRHEAGSGPRADLYARSNEFVKEAFGPLCASVGIDAPEVPLADVTRVNAGVRPVRASGPRVELDAIGSKVVVHNYGHGAHGWTLGYGSAREAVALAGLL